MIRLSHRRVLVVEDEVMIGLDLVQLLESHGAIVLGPASNVDEALHLMAGSKVDCAVLDVNLAGVHVAPVVQELQRSATPFVFVTGYYGKDLLPSYRSHPIFQKPFNPEDLIDTIAQIVPRLPH